LDDAVAMLLPGMTLNASIFPDIGLPSVPVEFNDLVVSPDGTPPDDAAPGMALYADLLDTYLAGNGTWQAPRRLVVAHSFGGMLIMSWLLRHGCAGPAGIDGLVLIATTGGPMYDAVGLRVARLGSVDARIPVTPSFRLWNTPFVTRAVKGILSGGLACQRVDFQKLLWQSDLALDLAGWRNTDWRAMRTFRIAMDGFDVRERLSEIRVPTIVLHGSEDAVFPPDVGRRLAAALPTAEFRLVEGAAHGLPLTHGEAVVRAVEDLVGGTG
jgi:pimeloyl-ACP methyl ester carboxylesterase